MTSVDKVLKIIVIDDNKIFRESISHYITKRLGYEVIASFEDSLEFLESPIYYKADIVLMDIEMPKMDGITLTKKLILKDASLKIIAITSYQDKAYLTKLIYAGFKGCVFKNNIYEELNKAIKKVLNKRLYFPNDIKMDNDEKNKDG